MKVIRSISLVVLLVLPYLALGAPDRYRRGNDDVNANINANAQVGVGGDDQNGGHHGHKGGRQHGNGDHKTCGSGQEGEQSKDETDGKTYQCHNGIWEVLNQNGDTGGLLSPTDNLLNLTKWGSKKTWQRGQLEERRYDTDTNKWYCWNGNEWVVDTGKHLTWRKGKDGEERTDEENGKVYRCHGGVWEFVRKIGDSSSGLLGNTIGGVSGIGGGLLSSANNLLDLNRWGSKKNWNNGQSEERRYDTDTKKWYCWNGSKWVPDTGDHVNWPAGKDGEIRVDKANGKRYRCHNRMWEFLDKNASSGSVGEAGSSVDDNHNWGPKSSWTTGQADEERLDASSNKWYRYDGTSHTWVIVIGAHLKWPPGKEGERRHDDEDDHWYVCRGGRWVRDKDRSSK